jgi:antitoxin Phd
MQKQYSIAEAKSKLPTIFHEVEKGPSVELTRRGEPVVVLLSIDEFKRLNLSNSGFWKELTSFRKRIESEKNAISGQSKQRMSNAKRIDMALRKPYLRNSCRTSHSMV